MVTEINPRTYFFRPTRTDKTEPVLNPVLVASNASMGIETTLILDTNLLVAMERVVKEGNKKSIIKKYGLHNLIDMLSRCPPKSIFLSPGRAFDEMPPALAEQSRKYFDIFCSTHLPSFVDTPNSIRKIYAGKLDNYGYLDLDLKAQAFLAIPYACLLYLNIIDKKFPGKPIEKFQEFLRRLSYDVDIVSSKEVEIAKYCFANPSPSAIETIRLRKIFRANFLKTKNNKAVYSYEEAMAVAFNGACDLVLINFANVMQTRGLDGQSQDCWIATRDKKLFEYSKVVHYLDAFGEAGLIAVSTQLPENQNDEYWQQANLAHTTLVQSRIHRHLRREIDDVHALLKVAETAIGETAHAFN